MWALVRRTAAPRNGGGAGALVRAVVVSASAAASPCASRLLPRAAPENSRWSSSSSIWKQRQANDPYTRQAKAEQYKSRAAFKLAQIHEKYRIFKRGQTVIDLGYAPGGWSQIAMELTKPNGRVVGIDIIPAKPPMGVSAIQGNFLSPGVRQLVKDYLVDFVPRRRPSTTPNGGPEGGEEGVVVEKPSYIDTERAESAKSEHDESAESDERLVDIVLSDMSEALPQTEGFSLRTLSNPYSYFHRLQNTTGMKSRDHILSMNLCYAALEFASETLRTGGHFVCKFLQGAEDKKLELRLKKMFEKVHREKPDSSRKESSEMYFVALRRKRDVTFADITND
ncbi:2' O-ribose methyltransferase [Parahypoxylon ruwenzoriense]